MTLANGDTDAPIRTAIDELPADEARNPNHVYARILRKAIRKGLVLDELHLRIPVNLITDSEAIRSPVPVNPITGRSEATRVLDYESQ